MLTRIHIASLVIITMVSWFLCLWVQGLVNMDLKLFGPFSLVVGIVTVIIGVFNKWAWSWRIFKGWYVKRPDLRGTWKVELKSNWISPETQEEIPPIIVYMAVRQSLITMSMRLMTPESKSELITHSIEQLEDAIYQVAGIYRNEPGIELQGKRSEIHYGSIILNVVGDPPIFLEGHYWTDRNTRGSMKLTDRTRDIFDTYELAAKALSSR